MRTPRRNLSKIRCTRNETEFRRLIKRYPDRPVVIAEGDSWFAWPKEWLIAGKASNVIAHLTLMHRFNLLQLASNGDEVVDMLSGESKFRLVKLIEKYHVDYLLFSGGGNDIVGAYDFDFFLRANPHADSFDDYINLPRLHRRISQIQNAYRDLLDLCDQYSLNKDIKIVTHAYDYAVPDPKGAIFADGHFKIDHGKSWMYPYLKTKKVPAKWHRDIVRYFIDALGAFQKLLQQERPDRIIFADTRGTLKPGKKDWLNEIHPTPRGFKKVALKICQAMGFCA